jgi:ubiquitin carboxyl-terminal hydrolase 4/11
MLDKDNEWYCSRCKTHVQASKKMDFYQIPKYLILHLKRFKNSIATAEKNTLKVDFPLENLDLTNYVLNRKPMKTSLGMEVEDQTQS